MSYMHDLERELHDRLASFAAGDLSAHDFITFMKKTVLESYRNGQKAGPRQPDEPHEETGEAPAKTAVPQTQWNDKRSAGAPPPRRGYYKPIDTNRLRR
jgi:hypothetical protein